jgi:hypothetical protein
METTNQKIYKGIKILGVGLLFLVIPGSAIAIPWVVKKFAKKIKDNPTKKIFWI